MKRLVIATTNPGKAQEIARILSDLGLEIRSLSDYPPMPEPEETGEGFVENAVIKALAAARHTGEIALADDSGLVIDALGGEPGIYSDRFAGEGATDEDRNAKVLELMQDVQDRERTARFAAAVAIAGPGGVIFTAEGSVSGYITREPRGKGGFGYDPIFRVKHLGKTMAELPPEKKDRISHRGRALRKARSFLEAMVRLQDGGAFNREKPSS